MCGAATTASFWLWPKQFVLLQFALLFGSVNIYDFIEADVFTSTFEDPEEAKKSGLNQFFFVTERPGFVICGALVRLDMLSLQQHIFFCFFLKKYYFDSSLSTTVSLLLLSAMAFTRHQVVASAASQHRVFRWASANKVSATLIPWTVGLLITSLHFVNFTHVFAGEDEVRNK